MLALSYLSGTAAAIWLAFLIVSLAGYDWVTPLFIGITATGWLHKHWLYAHKNELMRWAPSQATYSLLLLLMVLLCVFTPLFTSRMLQEREGGLWSGGSTWGDLALHTTFIRQFARQETFDLTSPIYSQTQTNYPFLLNLYAGLLYRGGFSLQASLMLTGWSLLIASCVVWFSLLQRFTGTTVSGWLSLFVFFTNGGFGFIYAYQDYLQSRMPLSTFILHQSKNYTHLEQDGLYWSNVVVDIFLPQRTFTAGFMVFVIFMWVCMYGTAHPKSQPRLWVFLLGLTALTPLLHTHAFLTLTGLLVCLTAYYLWRKVISWREALVKGLFFLALTVPQYAWQTMHTATTQSFIATKVGWYTLPGQSVLSFWLENMGVGAFFFAISFLWLIVTLKKQTVFKICLLALHLLFFIANILQFQPFLFDNMKFMVFSYFAVATVIGASTASLSFPKALLLWIAIPLAALSGLLALIRESTTHWEMASASAIEQAAELSKILEPQAIVLTADTHVHPIPFLVGNPVVMGYRGWLWSHGFDFSTTEQDIGEIYAGGSRAQELLQQYKVRYVYISSLERAQYGVQETFFMAHYPRVYHVEDTAVYKIE